MVPVHISLILVGYDEGYLQILVFTKTQTCCLNTRPSYALQVQTTQPPGLKIFFLNKQSEPSREGRIPLYSALLFSRKKKS
mmetsp:Transcript_16685/g.25282  ORF Transcript_16685/g.25282 Transcript_16685/m.25282 type:complete len:81 (+) Transcript_16685:128-370(+)